MACSFYPPIFVYEHAQATQIGIWRRAEIRNMAAGFSKRGGDPAQVDDVTIDKLHPSLVSLRLSGRTPVSANGWRAIF